MWEMKFCENTQIYQGEPQLKHEIYKKKIPTLMEIWSSKLNRIAKTQIFRKHFYKLLEKKCKKSLF